jgi:hypothetical protein
MAIDMRRILKSDLLIDAAAPLKSEPGFRN